MIMRDYKSLDGCRRRIPHVESPLEGDPDWAGGTIFEDKRNIEICADINNV